MEHKPCSRVADNSFFGRFFCQVSLPIQSLTTPRANKIGWVRYILSNAHIALSPCWDVQLHTAPGPARQKPKALHCCSALANNATYKAHSIQRKAEHCSNFYGIYGSFLQEWLCPQIHAGKDIKVVACALQSMCAEYVAGRKECVRLAMSHAAAFGFKDEVLHDAVLLVDRTMCSGTPLPPAMLPLLVAACILISARQGDFCVIDHSLFLIASFHSSPGEVQHKVLLLFFVSWHRSLHQQLNQQSVAGLGWAGPPPTHCLTHPPTYK